MNTVTDIGNATTAGSSSSAGTPVPPPPAFLRPNFERMPPELKQRKNWVLWALVWNGTKWTKRPIQPSGFGASTTNPRHWRSFDDVKQAYEAAIDRGHIELREKGKPPRSVSIGGIGFVFDGKPDQDGLVLAGVDFDKVIVGSQIAPFAENYIKRLGSYTERSVSGGGLHVIVKARPLPSGVAHGGVEMYTAGRFFTMTGRASAGTKIVSVPDEFAAVAGELLQSARTGAPDKSASTVDNVVRFPEWAINRPASAFACLPIETFGIGLDTNIEEIRSAVSAIPPSAIPPSAISTEPEWMGLARGLAHEAAVYKNQAEQLREILDTASRRAPGYNEEDNRSRWLRYISEAFNRDKPITIATVFDLAKKHGWQGWSPPVTATAAAPPVWSSNDLKVSFSNIPHRQWIYGVDLIRGENTVIGSPGGVGKSSQAIGMAISIATGKELLGEKVRGGNDLKVVLINAEDSGTEIQRRTWAFCLVHNIPEQSLNRLYVAGADDARVQRLSFLHTTEKNVSCLNPEGFGVLEDALEALRPDVLILDPLVALCSGGNMNDNTVMALVMRELKRLAIKFDCAILIVHHTRKGGDAGNAEAISGAAAIINLARRAIMPVTMTDDEAKKYGVLPSERLSYFKLVDAKSNLAPRSADSPWYRLHSVELPNPEPPLYPHGDNVQAVTRVNLSLLNNAAATIDEQKIQRAILDVVDRGKIIDGQSYPFSPSIAGAKNERSLLDDAMAAVRQATAPRQWSPVDLEAVTKRAIDKMKNEGGLVVGDMKDLMSKSNRFRKGRGLKVDWARTPWPNANAGGGTAASDAAAPDGGQYPGQINDQFPHGSGGGQLPPL